MEIINNYINWLNSKSQQYVEVERDEKERVLYLKKYGGKIPSISRLSLYCLIPIFGPLFGANKVENASKFQGVVGVLFDENGKVLGVTKKEDEKFLKEKYNSLKFEKIL